MFPAVFSLFPYQDADGSRIKLKLGADLVFKIPLVGKVEQLGPVAEENEGRRFGRSLGTVVDFQPLSLVGRGLDTGSGIGKHVVEPAGRDTHGILGGNAVDHAEQPVYPLAGFGR